MHDRVTENVKCSHRNLSAMGFLRSLRETFVFINFKQRIKISNDSWDS